MTDPKDHPEQDPAEGSREMIERDLKRQEEKGSGDETTSGKDLSRIGQAGAEAAEPSPGN